MPGKKMFSSNAAMATFLPTLTTASSCVFLMKSTTADMSLVRGARWSARRCVTRRLRGPILGKITVRDISRYLKKTMRAGAGILVPVPVQRSSVFQPSPRDFSVGHARVHVPQQTEGGGHVLRHDLALAPQVHGTHSPGCSLSAPSAFLTLCSLLAGALGRHVTPASSARSSARTSSQSSVPSAHAAASSAAGPRLTLRNSVICPPAPERGPGDPPSEPPAT